ncbi:hypothetical protein ACFL2Q_09665 [Thermodesulfobacteriota bacterium]
MIALICGIVTTACLGRLYQKVAMFAVPYPLLTPILSVSYGAAIGWAVAFGLKLDKSRSLFKASALAFVFAVAGDILTFVYGYSDISAAMHRIKAGWDIPNEYGIDYDNYAGVYVYLVWAFELICIVIPAVALARSKMRAYNAEFLDDQVTESFVKMQAGGWHRYERPDE